MRDKPAMQMAPRYLTAAAALFLLFSGQFASASKPGDADQYVNVARDKYLIYDKQRLKIAKGQSIVFKIINKAISNKKTPRNTINELNRCIQFMRKNEYELEKYSLFLWAYWRFSYLQSNGDYKFKILCKIIPTHADFPLRLTQGSLYILEHQNYPDKRIAIDTYQNILSSMAKFYTSWNEDKIDPAMCIDSTNSPKMTALDTKVTSEISNVILFSSKKENYLYNLRISHETSEETENEIDTALFFV